MIIEPKQKFLKKYLTDFVFMVNSTMVIDIIENER